MNQKEIINGRREFRDLRKWYTNNVVEFLQKHSIYPYIYRLHQVFNEATSLSIQDIMFCFGSVD